MVIALLATACGTTAPGYDPKSGPWDRGTVYLGGFLPDIDSTASVGTQEGGAGIEINFEDALGLDTTDTVLRGGASLRFGDTRRHAVELDYLGLKRTASKTLENDITVEGTLYPAGTEVSSRFDLEIVRSSYAYSFYMDERVNLAGAFGIYALPIEIQLAGAANSEGSSFTAPLPTFGLHLDFAIQPNLFLRQRLDLFYLEIDQFEGGMLDLDLGIEYRPWEHVGIGLAYNRFNIAIEAQGEDYPGIDFEGDLDYQYSGVLLYLVYAF